MRTPIKWAELHGSIFLAGSNLLSKLDPSKRLGLVMEYDEQRRHLYVTYNGQTARVPETSVLSMVEAEQVVRSGRAVVGLDVGLVESGSTTVTVPVATNGGTFTIATAQVSTPQSHVFAGPGGGQTGQEGKRGPGRPKKA